MSAGSCISLALNEEAMFFTYASMRIERCAVEATSDRGRLLVTCAHNGPSVCCQKLLQMRSTVPKNFMSTL